MASPARSSSSASAQLNTSSGSVGGTPTKAGVSYVPPPRPPILSKPRLQELIREIDPTTQFDEDVEEALLQIADDFVEDAIKSSCAYAKHRKSSKVETRDVQLHLDRKWQMWIPGFGTEEVRPYKRASMTEAHKQRLALIKKTVKKY